MPGSLPDNDKVKTAVITGNHPYDVPGFHAVFRDIPEIEFYPQDLVDFVVDAGGVRKQYDALVFYNMHTEGPEGRVKDALSELGETGQGIFVLHHAILAYPKWDLWAELCGVPDRSFGFYHAQGVHVEIANHDHPITSGLKDWDMIDETYTMNDPGEGSDILLTTDHPKSMKALGWTRQFKNARCFCLQCGHDNQTYVEPNFREVVKRGILWVSGRM